LQSVLLFMVVSFCYKEKPNLRLALVKLYARYLNILYKYISILLTMVIRSSAALPELNKTDRFIRGKNIDGNRLDTHFM
jgi:hypothetical protein